MANKISPEAADAEYHLKEGEHHLVKISGSLLKDPGMKDIVSDLQKIAARGIKITIVCGAGAQNTGKMESYLQSQGLEYKPEMVEGVRKTSKEELENAVIPVNREIRALMKELLPDANVLTPQQIHCTQVASLGYTGEPQEIEGLDDNNITVVCSVGVDGEQPLNINATGIARAVTAQGHLDEVFLVTSTGGVLHKGDIAKLLFTEDFDTDGHHKRVNIQGGMQNNTKEANLMLEHVDRVVITSIDGIRKELEGVLGYGTMVVKKSSLRCEHICGDDEIEIYKTLFHEGVSSGDFKSRTDEEFKELLKYAYTIKVGSSVLAAFALVPKGAWTELSTICSGYNGSGIGDVILQAAQAELLREEEEEGNKKEKREKMYAFASSRDSVGLFTRNYFENLGPVSELKKEHNSFYDYLQCVKGYDTSKRGCDPCFCTWYKGIDDVRRF